MKQLYRYAILSCMLVLLSGSIDARSRKRKSVSTTRSCPDALSMECIQRRKKERWWYGPPQIWYGWGEYFAPVMNLRYYDGYPFPGYCLGCKW